MRKSWRFWQWLLVGAAMVAVFSLTFVLKQRDGLDVGATSRAFAAGEAKPYDLTQLRVFNRVLVHIKEHYVEPERVDPKTMLLGALFAVQRKVAPVLVHHENDAPNFSVQVGGARAEYKLDDIKTPWAMALRAREIFAFIQRNLKHEDIDLRDVEYAAVNGMLHSLDPHSLLLTPDVYTEMQMSTRGEFGGLGIVISIRDGQLTVIKPMDGTPASKAGIKRKDRIVKINDESTLNMPLSEAVNRLRGPPNSKVRMWVVREGTGGWKQPKPFDLVRAIIHIPSVESRMFAGGTGYVRINSFQGNTHDDMMGALRRLHRQGLKGLILDMRDNPGGLLDQAVRVVDTFLSHGTIVTTSSNEPSERDVKVASAEGTEPPYPMVVLVNGGAASASEIVAGALKNHHRALIVGQQTFGKGSVQVIYDYPDGSALKLTVAQYLTPGDLSIQGVGIVPDVAIDSMTVDRDDMDLVANSLYVREADLRAHLTNKRARTTIKPSHVLRYYLPKETRDALRETDPEDVGENERENEFLIRFARDVLALNPEPRTDQMISVAKGVIAKMHDAEMRTAARELKRIGIEWAEEAQDAGPTTYKVEVTSNRKNNTVRAGETLDLTVKVTNTGKAPVYQLAATTESDNGLFDGREFVFGRIDPGKSKAWTTGFGLCTQEHKPPHCPIPRASLDRADAIRVVFREAHQHIPPMQEVRVRTMALPRPLFAYSLQIADTRNGDGDGVLERGEGATLFLKVRNVGAGRAFNMQANLRSLSGRGILLRDGRFVLGPLEPNQERTVPFTFDVLPEYGAESVKLEVALGDEELAENVRERVELPIQRRQEDAVASVRQTVWARTGIELLEQPRDGAHVVGVVPKGQSAKLESDGKLAGFLRVNLGEGRPAWVKESSVTTTGPQRNGGRIEDHLDREPPRLSVDAGKNLITRSPTLRLKAEATDSNNVRDMYVFVGSRKVFYQSNAGTSHPQQASFDHEIPLRKGINYITVVARENADVGTKRTVVVRRDGPNGELLKTPKVEDEMWSDELEEPAEP